MSFKPALFLLAACFAGSAVADDIYGDMNSSTDLNSNTQGSAVFDRLDTDDDGNLTQSEVGSEPALLENWSRIDDNGDGMLDRAEFSMFEIQEDQPSGGVGVDAGVDADVDINTGTTGTR